MIERNGKYGSFLGCSAYPRCKTIVNLPKNNTPKILRKIENPSHYQKGFENFVINGQGNGLGMATAGSGKTRTQEHIIAILMQDLKVPESDIIYAAFNSHVAKEAQEKGLPARTTHSIGFEAIRNYKPGIKVEVNEYKVSDIVKSFGLADDDKWMISPVCQIVGKLKNTLAPWDDDTQSKICDKFGIEVNGSSEIIFTLVRRAMEENNKILDKIDFDDQIYLPIKLKLPVKQYKWVLGDETQDWNLCQIMLAQRIVAPGGRVLCVGDKNQSMYSFRGAAPDAMDRIQAAFNAQILPLSISYRNPKSHVRLINSLFPDIKHEMWENAIEGEILSMSIDKMLGELKDGDLVICRNNAPLVQPVFALIRQGVKAIIRGRDIGKNLVSLVERFKAKETIDLIEKMTEYKAKEVAKLLKAEKTGQAQSLEDKVETIIALSEGCQYTWEIVQKINEVFSDKKEGVVFSTVHRAKGDEAENVFILKPQLMPSKYAKSEEDMIQERNVLFVALSRSKNKLVFVGGPAPIAFESNEMWGEDENLEEIEAQVIEQLQERLPEGTQLFQGVNIYEDGTVTVEKKLNIKSIGPCPF